MLMDDCKPNRHFFADRCCHWTNSKLIRIPNCSSKSLRIPIRVTDDIPTWTEFLRMVSNRSSQTHSPALAPQSKCSLALCLFDTLVAHTGELNNAGWTPGSGRPTLPGDMYFAASVGFAGADWHTTWHALAGGHCKKNSGGATEHQLNFSWQAWQAGNHTSNAF